MERDLTRPRPEITSALCSDPHASRGNYGDAEEKFASEERRQSPHVAQITSIFVTVVAVAQTRVLAFDEK